MSSSINLSNFATYNSDVMQHLFSFLDTRENLQTISVCKSWKKVIADVIKIEYRLKAARMKEELNQKMSFFLKNTGETVEDYFPLFEEIEQDRCILPALQIHDLLDHMIQEKHTVSIGKCLVVDPDTVDITFAMLRSYREEQGKELELKEITSGVQSKLDRMSRWQVFADVMEQEPRAREIAGKPYIAFKVKHRGQRSRIWVEKNIEIVRHKKIDRGCICYFPIHLFNLEVQNKNVLLNRDNAESNYCIPLRGRLVEFIVLPSDSSHSIPISRIPFEGNVLLCEFYDPHLHSKFSQENTTQLQNIGR